MKFTEKYEILELLTSGRISSFRARERSSQDIVIVHTFECPRSEPLPSSTAAIMMKFASLGANPPGVVLKAGLDEASSSAYLVTKMPNAAVLQEWIHAYRVNTRNDLQIEVNQAAAHDATAELSASEVDRLLAQSGRARPPQSAAELRDRREITEPLTASPPAPQSGGEFTRLFQELGAFQPRSTGRTENAKPRAPVKSGPPVGPENPMPREPLAPRAESASTPASEAHDFTKFFAEKKETPAGQPLAFDSTSQEPIAANEPGTFTQQFLSSDINRGGSDQGANPSAPPQEPGSFTKEFLAGGERTRQEPDAFKPRLSEAKPPQSPQPPSTMFGGMFDSGSSESRSSTGRFERDPEPAKSGAGEFTSFFRGPFDQPSAPGKPIEISNEPPARPSREQTGDFTRVFGKGGGEREDESPRMQPPEPKPQPHEGTFTQIFGDGGARLGGSRLDTGTSRPGSFNPIAGPTPPPQRPPAPLPLQTPSVPSPLPASFTPRPMANMPSSTLERSFSQRPGGSDATDVFRTPGGDAPEASFSGGPSEFTQFISRSEVQAVLPSEPALAPPRAAPQPPLFQFAPPPAPAPPAIPAAPTPAFAAPKPPTLPGPPASASSYWPLITVLTVLVAIAAILIMYFVLKH